MREAMARRRPTVPPPPGLEDPIEGALKQAFEGPKLGYPDPLNQRGKK
jgi:hypothetical protein